MAMAEKISKVILNIGGKEYEFAGGGDGSQPAPNSVGTDEIKDGGVEMEDLAPEVKDKLTDTYDSGSRTLYLSGAKPKGSES